MNSGPMIQCGIKNEQMIQGKKNIQENDKQYDLFDTTGMAVKNKHEQTCEGQGQFKNNEFPRTELDGKIHDGIELHSRTVNEVI